MRQENSSHKALRYQDLELVFEEKADGKVIYNIMKQRKQIVGKCFVGANVANAKLLKGYELTPEDKYCIEYIAKKNAKLCLSV